MCGICGFTGTQDKKILHEMMEVLRHRGPDDSGIYIDDYISLGHVRLSIIDLKTGRQPIHNEDESIWIVYNGEVYNFRELRRELEDRHEFYTQSDTEVLVHAYEEYGIDFLKKLNGMFAFAIWDSTKKILILARDRFGIKPLYYCKNNDSFVFASEIKAILQHDVERKINEKALVEILNINEIVGGKTIFENIYKLQHGEFLIYDVKNKRLLKKRYYDINFNIEKNVDERFYVEMYRKIFFDAVKRHMISDVPIGALLSGGLDTSSIVAAMSMLSEEPIKTFTMGFGEPADEIEDARIVAEEFSTEHKEFIIDPYEAFRIYPKLIWFLDSPKVNNIYTYFVYKLVKENGVKVVLSGLGGDEFLAGYVYRYRQIDNTNKLPKKPIKFISKFLKFFMQKTEMWKNNYKLKRYINVLSYIDSFEEFYVILTGAFEPSEFKNIFNLNGRVENIFDEARKILKGKETLHPYEKFALLDYSWSLPEDLLFVDDSMSMANSIEVRVPFLDVELVEFSLNIPWSLKYDGKLGKIVLRKAFKDILPEEVFKKPKQGFGPTMFNWYVKGVKPLAEEILPGGVILKEGFVDKYFIEKILKKKPKEKNNRFYSLIQNLAGLEVWYRIYIESDTRKLDGRAIESIIY